MGCSRALGSGDDGRRWKQAHATLFGSTSWLGKRRITMSHPLTKLNDEEGDVALQRHAPYAKLEKTCFSMEGGVMASAAQISAAISPATKEALDRFTDSHGLKKNYVVEQALLYFMEARRSLPDEALIPVRIVLDEEGFDRLTELVEEPAEPTEALRELMRDHG